jgi:hypothetical protein
MVLADWCGSLTAAASARAGAPLEVLAERVVEQLPEPGSPAAGRGCVWFTGPVFEGLWALAARAGAQVVAELPADMAAAPVADGLADGSYVSEVFGARVRVIAGAAGRLVTTLIDGESAEQLAVLHASRWPAGEVVHRVLGHRAPTLRSQSAAGVEQEIWALLALYQAMGRPLVDPAGWLPTGALR